MEAILQALPEMGGEKEILAASWRSRPPLVALVNAVFKGAFQEALSPEEIELKAQRSDAAEGLSEPAFANWLLGGKNLTEEKSALAAGILKLLDSGYQIFDKDLKTLRRVRFGDIAILSRTNTGVDDIALNLSLRGIPSATSQPGLLGTPRQDFECCRTGPIRSGFPSIDQEKASEGSSWMICDGHRPR